MSLTEVSTPRLRVRRVVEPSNASSSPPLASSSTSKYRLTARRAYLDRAETTKSTGPRRAGLEASDGIIDCISSDEQDKLKEALRRSASRISPSQPASSMTYNGNPGKSADQLSSMVSRVRIRREAAQNGSSDLPKEVHDVDCPFVSKCDRQPAQPRKPFACDRNTRESSGSAIDHNGLDPSLASARPLKDCQDPAPSRLSGPSPPVSSSPTQRTMMQTRTSEERLAQIRARLSRLRDKTSESPALPDPIGIRPEMVRRWRERVNGEHDEKQDPAFELPSRDHSPDHDIKGQSKTAIQRSIASRSNSLDGSCASMPLTSPSQTSPRPLSFHRNASSIEGTVDTRSSSPATVGIFVRSRLAHTSSHHVDQQLSSESVSTRRRPPLQRSGSSEDGIRQPFTSISYLENGVPSARRRRDDKAGSSIVGLGASPRRAPREPSTALNSPEPRQAHVGARRDAQQRLGKDNGITNMHPARRDKSKGTNEAMPSEAVQSVGKLQTNLRRHQERLVESEKCRDQAGNSPRKGLVTAPSIVSSSVRPGLTFLEKARAARARAQTSAAEALAKQEAEEISLRAAEVAKIEEAERDRLLEQEAEQARLRALRTLTRRKTLQYRPTCTAAPLSEDEADEARVEKEVTPLSDREVCPDASGKGEAMARVAKVERKAMRALHARPTDLVLSSSQDVDHPAVHGDSTGRYQSVGETPRAHRHSAVMLHRRISTGATPTSSSSFPHRLAALSYPSSSEGIFRGVVVLVDARDQDGADLSLHWCKLLREHGAKVASRAPSTDSKRSLTHIVWKNPKPSTLKYFRGLQEEERPLLVGIGWIANCLLENQRVKEEAHLVEVGRNAVWQLRRRNAVGSSNRLSSAFAAPSLSHFLDKNIQKSLQAVLEYAPLIPSPLRTADTLDLGLRV